MVRPTDQEKIGSEKTVLLPVPKRRGTSHHAGLHGEAPGFREEEGKTEREASLWFLGDGMDEASCKQA